MQLGKRHFNAVQSALRKRSFEVKESKSWLEIHVELGVGELGGGKLSLSRQDHALLRDWVKREVGSDPITTDLIGDRLAMSELARNEKWSDQGVFSGMVRVASTDGQIPICGGDITVPQGALMQIAAEEIDTSRVQGVVIVENGIIARNWYRCSVPSEILAYLMVYRGHGADARACADWLKTLPRSVTKIGYFDLDPAGIGMAVDYKVDGVLAPRDLNDSLVAGANNKPDEYDKQINAMEPQVDLGAGQGVQFASRPDYVLWPAHSDHKPVAIFLDGYKYHDKSSSSDLLKRQSLMRAGYVVWTLNWYDVNQVMGDKAMDVPLPTGMTSPDHHHQAITRLARESEVGNHALHLSKTTFELLMHFLTEQDVDKLAQQALFFALQCFPALSLADAAVKTRVMENLDGLPAAFVDLQPSPVVLAGEMELHDTKSAATLIATLLAGKELLDGFDLESAMVTLCYDLRQGKEKDARYQWQRFWTAFNFLQFLPVFYAFTPASKHDGTAAGMEWPAIQTPVPEDGKPFTEPDWYSLLDDEIAEALRSIEIVWPEIPLIGDDLEDTSGEIVGLVEIAFAEEKIAFLMNEQRDIQPRLEAMGWHVCTSIAQLLASINQLNKGD